MTTGAQKQTTGIGKFVQAGLIGGAIATVINLILFFIGQGVNGGPLLVTLPGQSSAQGVPWFMVIVMSVLSGVVAGSLYGILNRFTAKPTPVFLVIAAVVFIFMFFNPISTAQGTTTILFLEVMHVVVAGFVIWRILGAARS